MNRSAVSMSQCAMLFMASVSVLATLSCGGMNASSANAQPRWDTDGDGFSNNVEVHAPNARYHLDTLVFNLDSTSVTGTYSYGNVLWAGHPGGINLPEDDDGIYQFQPNAGYYPNPPYDPLYDRPDSNDWGTLGLVNYLEAAGRAWDAFNPYDDRCYHYQHASGTYSQSRIGVGDMSKFGGGHWVHSYNGVERHGNHALGLEVDIRYLRLDGHEGPLDLRLDAANVEAGQPSNYDMWAMMDLINCLENDPQVNLIYADEDYLGFWNGTGSNILQDGGEEHKNHIHVQLRIP